MKFLTTKLLLLFCLALASGLAGADDRFDARRSYPTIGGGEWRLGSSRGGNGGYEILYRNSGRDRWQAAPGAAIAIADGWVLGTDHHRGGYGIYRWNGRGWSHMPGTAVRIGGSYRQPWVINELGIRFVWNGYDWQQEHNASRYDDHNRRDRGSEHDAPRRRDRDDEHGSQDRDWDRNGRDNRDNGGRDRDFH